MDNAIHHAADLVVKEVWRSLREEPAFTHAFNRISEGELLGMLRRQVEESARLIKIALDV